MGDQMKMPDQLMIMVYGSENDDNLKKFNEYVESNKKKLTDQNFFITMMSGSNDFKLQVSIGAQNLGTFNTFDNGTMDEIFKLVDLAKGEMAKSTSSQAGGQEGGRHIPQYKDYKYKYMKYKLKYMRHRMD